MRIIKPAFASAILLLFLAGCSDPKPTPSSDNASTSTAQPELKFSYEKYQLDNGLTVILHQDKSDPIVALSTVVHVGSNREQPGRTGFAHFFEHMAFNDSENVPMGANRKMIPELGGERNGGTWSDGTIYYEVVPKDAFDKLLWIDSDRLGFMINTVTQPTLEREKQVVKNEKRQRVDNRPYGHTDHVIRKALYPKGHPYSWTVIGDLEDLQAATLEDVKRFYNEFYTPSNVTLVIAGDIDIEETKQKVEYWFGEIAKGEKVDPLSPMPVTLEKDILLFHEDNFARLPEIRMTYPTVEQYHPDAYALDMLARVLAGTKDTPLYELIVTEKQLAPNVAAYHSSQEIAGTFTVRVRANADQDLDEVQQVIQQAFNKFVADGVSEDKLTRIRAQTETSFYQQFESILNKSLQLGIYNEYAGSPDFYKTEIERINAVTTEDIMRVFNQYIKDQPAVITSFVPKQKLELAVANSTLANVVEEQIVQGAETTFEEKALDNFTITPTKNDRSEPPLGELPALKVPEVWQQTTELGIQVFGIEQNELPLVNFSLIIPGGQLLDPASKEGVSSLMADMLMEGTTEKSAAEFEQALGLLGASLSVSANRYEIDISGRVLAKNYQATMALVGEMLLSPSFDQAAFDRLKQAQLTNIKQQQSNPSRVAYNAFASKLYGDNHPLGIPSGGTETSVENITLADVKSYYQQYVKPQGASYHIVGNISQTKVVSTLESLSEWTGEVAALPTIAPAKTDTSSRVYFIDIPNAKQSVIYIGKLLPDQQHPDSYAIEYANTALGGGISGRLAQTLRIEKGYTYGAYSFVQDGPYLSSFIASSQVRSNVTKESLQEFKRLVGQYKQTFGESDLATMQNMVIKGNSRDFETLNDKLRILEEMSKKGLTADYIVNNQDYVFNADLPEVHRVIDTYLQEPQMIYVIAGDAATQFSGVESFAQSVDSKVIELDINGDPVTLE
ncbi:M16 family metallopeptidase [Glaciecola sp. 1036]|uniref:M16 family metallopeptidase n=1 Tax=Alteromonadaceae TaxID=72275 RepID=UPI003D064A5E